MEAAIKENNLDVQLQNNHDEKQYLTFIMDGEEYGIDITMVMEIRQWELPTPLPNVSSFVSGVINLRGAIIPVINLRAKFFLDKNENENAAVIIVVQIQKEGEDKLIGMLVDTVSDVYNIADHDIQKSDMLEHLTLADHVRGMFQVDKRIITILDINSVLSVDDLDT